MADETVTPVEEEATPIVEGTPPPQPNPEPKPQTDWEAAYKGLQPKLQREVLENRIKDERLSELEGAFKSLQVGQKELIKATLGEDQARALDAQLFMSQQESARTRAAGAARQFIDKQTSILVSVLETVGVDPRTVDWGADAHGVEDWAERVNADVKAKVQAKVNQLTNAVEKVKLTAKAEATAEAKRLSQETLRDAGVGRIDSSRGSSSARTIYDMDPNSKEFGSMVKDALAGKLKSVK